jgi:hypothetical protein
LGKKNLSYGFRMRIQIQKRCVANIESVKSAIAATENGFGNIVHENLQG